MTFDKELMLAEIERFEILVAHHLRRVEIAKDVETARRLRVKFGSLEHKAHAVVKRLLQNKEK